MATCDCGAEFTPNAYKQVKCNTCRFPQRTGRRPSGVPNPIQWRDIPGYEGRYEINTLGTIRSLLSQEYMLTPYWQGSGYRVRLSLNGVKKTHWVHRLLMITFAPIEDMDKHIVVCTGDNPRDLSLRNWEWRPDTALTRARHAVLTPDEAMQIRRTLLNNADLTYADIASNYHVSESAIKHLMSGKTWKDAS